MIRQLKNAGVDHISIHQKLHDFSIPGERVILLCSSGNLSVTQAVMTLFRRDIKSDTAGHCIPWEIYMRQLGRLIKKCARFKNSIVNG